jgi:hypothetical protein
LPATRRWCPVSHLSRSRGKPADVGVPALVARWREEAGLFRRRGQASLAELLESVAAELHAAIEADSLQLLTLQEAAAESGLSYSALEKAVRTRRIPNAGAPGHPRIRRGDLPRKPQTPSTGPSGLAERVLASRL